MALGPCEKERDLGEEEHGEGERRPEALRGDAGGVQGGEGAARQGGGGRRVRARWAHALLPTGRRLKTVAVVVGWAAAGLHSVGPLG